MEQSLDNDLVKCIYEGLDMKHTEPSQLSPLVLAYIGDSIYDLVIKTWVIEQGNMQVNKLNKKTSSIVKAESQSAMIGVIEPMLSEHEEAVYKRGRNAKSYTSAKNASIGDYRRATGFEALMGYLYLSGQYERMMELVKAGLESLMRYNELTFQGRNAVLEAFRSGKTIDKLFILDGCQDGPIKSIVREAKKTDAIINYVDKERLDRLAGTGHHQGVVAIGAAYEYAEVEDILAAAKEKGEDPFIFILDEIEDPHNLGAIIRTANLAGAHGVIIPKRRAVGLTATVAKTSAGAINYTPVAKVTNISQTIEELKKQGLWFVCADMGGETMYNLNLKGPIGLVIGNEGNGVSRLVKDKCDFIASIPMKGDIDSLNASVAAGVLAYEIVRQRLN